MAWRYGAADSGEANGFRLTVEAPTGTTSAAPVEVGDIFKLSGTDADGGGYKVAALVDEDGPDSVVLVQAMERAIGEDPMTVNVLGRYQQVVRLPYLVAEIPALGDSIKTSATVTKVGSAAFDGTSYVLHVDTTLEEVEVLV